LERARKAGKRLGRPTVGIEKEAALKAALTRGHKGILKIATEHKVGSSVVQPIKREPSRLLKKSLVRAELFRILSKSSSIVRDSRGLLS
jgi:hypothetical protein